MILSTIDFIREKFLEGLTVEDVKELYEDYLGYREEEGLNGIEYSSWLRTIRRVYNEESITFSEEKKKANLDVLLQSSQVMRQNQRLQDTSRVERKIFREDSRYINLLETLNKELIDLIPKIPLLKTNIKKNKIKNNDILCGCIQISDVHGNELINSTEMINNQYDFEVASARLKKYVDKADEIFKAKKISHIFIAFLGDLINSMRRTDEYLNAATNRMKATLLVTHLLKEMILDLLSRGYSLTIGSVTGNESRVGDFNEFSAMVVTENFDFLIHNILKIMFEKHKQITFVEGDYKELVVNIEGFKTLILHGDSIRNIDKDIKGLYSRYALKGILLDYILFGHLHEAYISDLFSRSSSLCGANAYSEKALNLSSRASQNIHIFYRDKSVDSFKLDLQNVNREDGYNVIEELKAYNAKSSQKLHSPTTILEIRI